MWSSEIIILYNNKLSMQNVQLEVSDEYDKEFILLIMGITIYFYIIKKLKKDMKCFQSMIN